MLSSIFATYPEIIGNRHPIPVCVAPVLHLVYSIRLSGTNVGQRAASDFSLASARSRRLDLLPHGCLLGVLNFLGFPR